MSLCSICCRRITRNQPLYLNTNVCIECITKIKNSNYEITITDECERNLTNVCNTSVDIMNNEIVRDIYEENKIEFVNSSSNKLNSTKETDINTVIEEPTFNCIDDHKDALLASLYCQVNFLKKEIEEKNFLLRTLLIKENEKYNNKDFIMNCDMSFYEKEDNENYSSSTTGSLVSINEDVSDNDINDIKLDGQLDLQTIECARKIEAEKNIKIQLLQIREHKHEEYLRLNRNGEDHTAKDGNFTNTICDNFLDEKSEVRISKAENKTKKGQKKRILIVSDSMFNQIDEKRLSKQYNVKLRAFSGASTDDMYWYLEPLLAKEPDYILLHVGTNSCFTKSSDEILDDLLKIKHHIETILPNCVVILSQPIIRTDNQIAAKTINELIVNFDKLEIRHMNNSNIKMDHLGKRGLHLNDHGTRILAMNIISLIRGL